MNDYLSAKEGYSSYSSTSNHFFENEKDEKDILKITLTPICFLKNEEATERNLMVAKSRSNKVVLECYFDRQNSFDDKALQVFVNNIFIGYIRKKYDNINRSEAINQFCFLDSSELNDVFLICINGIYYLNKGQNYLEKNKDDNIFTKAKQEIKGNTHKNKLRKKTNPQEMEEKIKELFEKTGWNHK